MSFPLSASRFGIVWLSMAVAMTANGITRELLLKRFLGGRTSDVISAVIGMVLIGLITWWGFRPIFAASPSTAQLITVSLALVVLTVGFETLLGRYVDHKTWPELLDHYALWRGELWPIVLAWLAYTPFAWSRV